MTARECVRRFAACVLLCAVAAGAFARGKIVLKADLLPLAGRGRTAAPIPVEVVFDNKGARLLEGVLDLTVREGRRIVGRYRTPELALTSGEQSFRFMLPAMAVDDDSMPPTVHMIFMTKKGSINLGDRTLMLPTQEQRRFVICIGEPLEEPNPVVSKIAQGLRIGRLNAKDKQVNPRLRPFATRSAYMAPDAFPRQPLHYCCYDLVFLAGDGFSLLREKQLESIRRWVEAGGSVCIQPRGRLKRYHVQFLNDLVGKRSAAFSTDAEGRLNADSGAIKQGTGLFRSGLGRTAVVLRPIDPEEDMDSRSWRSMVAFLWKVRNSQRQSVVDGVRWSTAQQESGRYGYRGMRATHVGVDDELSFAVHPIEASRSFVRSLLPQTVRLIPFWLVVFLLVLFVLAVGPGDYFLLGLLKKRRYTWVLLPVAAIAFTWTTVILSSCYMGRADREKGLEIVDVARDGRVLRRNRLELIFAGEEQETTAQLKGCLFSDLTGTGFGAKRDYYPGRRSERVDMPPLYAGWIPGAYTCTQQIKQWSPQVNRLFSMDPGDGRPDLRWAAIDPAVLKSHNLHDIKARLCPPGPFAGSILLFHKHEMYAFNGGMPPTFLLTGPRQGFAPEFVGIAGFIHQVCVRPGVVLFSVVSQISPTGGDNLEDLSILDPTDPNQWLLVVVIAHEDGFAVYRCLYHKDT